MSATRTRTGALRYRSLKRLFRAPLLILQMEWRIRGTVCDESPYGGMDEVDYIEWCDARVEDVSLVVKK